MPQGQQPECLFDGSDVQLLHFPGDGSGAYRLVSFDIMHARANRREAFASRFAVKNGVELFGIVPKYPCWYPAREMDQVCALIAGHRGPPALAYGSSMGGYGALRYGRQTGCAAVLAFSPQAHIAPGVTGQSDPRYGRFHDPVAHAQMTVRAAHLTDHNFVIHDPHSAFDSFQAGLLPAGQVTHFAVPHLGHRSVSTIASSQSAAAAFALALAGDAPGIAGLLRRGKKTAASYLAGMAQAALNHRHDPWALQIARQALALYPKDKDVQLVTAVSLGRLGQTKAASELLGQLIAGKPHVLKYRAALVQAWAHAQCYPQAIMAMRGALEVQDRFDLNVRLIRLLRLDRDWAEAKSVLQQTAQKWPDRQAELEKLAVRSAARTGPLAQTRVDLGTRPAL